MAFERAKAKRNRMMALRCLIQSVATRLWKQLQLSAYTPHQTQAGAFALSNTSKKILLIGETWMSSASHFKGFDQFGSVTFHSGAEPLVNALAGTQFELIHMPAHEAIEKLPFDLQGLNAYVSILLSDIGANSLLLHHVKTPNAPITLCAST
jgi:hypothetical protein